MTTTTERYTAEQMKEKAEELLKLKFPMILVSDMLWEAAKHFEDTATRLQSLEAENAHLREVLKELADLVDDIRSGNYVPDSFTTQPARDALSAK